MLRGSGATGFQISGITVFLHWSWLLVAVFEISGRTEAYSSYVLPARRAAKKDALNCPE